MRRYGTDCVILLCFARKSRSRRRRRCSGVTDDEDESGSNILKIMTSERPILYCYYYYVRRRRLYYNVHPYVYAYNSNTFTLIHSVTRTKMRFPMFFAVSYYYYHYNGHIIFGNIISCIKPTAARAAGDGDGGGAGAINVVCRVISPQSGPVAVHAIYYYYYRIMYTYSARRPELCQRSYSIHNVIYV